MTGSKDEPTQCTRHDWFTKQNFIAFLVRFCDLSQACIPDASGDQEQTSDGVVSLAVMLYLPTVTATLLKIKI